MKFIRIKVKNLLVTSESLISSLQANPFSLSIGVPLPDHYQSTVVLQKGNLSNYEILSENQYAFNSLSLYNFRVNETTLSQFVNSALRVEIPDLDVFGELSMNKLIMSHDFELKTDIELYQKVRMVEHVKVEGKKKMQEVLVERDQLSAAIEIEINLQSGDTEDELKRNF